MRRDVRDAEGTLRDGEPDAAKVEVLAVRHYPDFQSMVNSEGYSRVIPGANSAQEAADEYNKYYSIQDQAHYGVLAVEIRYVVT